MRRVEIAERPDWRATAEKLGFHFHTIHGETYWDESAYYEFTLEEIERDLEAPTGEIHEMAMALVEDCVRDSALLEKLAIPQQYWDWIAQSWREASPHVYGRMDLAYDGNGPAKLYELNYDTPTSLYEAAFFQWVWLEEQKKRGLLPADPGKPHRGVRRDREAVAAAVLFFGGARVGRGPGDDHLPARLRRAGRHRNEEYRDRGHRPV
jgi:glutathionylspermidine synthase